MFCRLPERQLPDLSVRSEIAEQILACLSASVPGSKARLRGSLANGTHDAYSDIDVLWEVEDVLFLSAVSSVCDLLSKIRPVQSLRIDPEFRNSPRHRLLFVRFERLPLFWRVDLDIFAHSARQNPNCDPGSLDLPANWSLTESALANAVAAIKACKRGQPKQARDLLERAFGRLELEFTVTDASDAIRKLLNHAKTIQPQNASLAKEIEQLITTNG